MGDILNNLTQEELQTIREKALNKRENRECLWCNKTISMRKDQRFCCAACRASYAYYAAQLANDSLAMEKAAWTREREELIREVTSLRARIIELEG